MGWPAVSSSNLLHFNSLVDPIRFELSEEDVSGSRLVRDIPLAFLMATQRPMEQIACFLDHVARDTAARFPTLFVGL